MTNVQILNYDFPRRVETPFYGKWVFVAYKGRYFMVSGIDPYDSGELTEFMVWETDENGEDLPGGLTMGPMEYSLGDVLTTMHIEIDG